MAQLHAYYVENWIPFRDLTERDQVLARKFLNTEKKREAVLRAVMIDGAACLDCEAGKRPQYFAERQSAGMRDFWHYSAVYHAVVSYEETRSFDLMQIFITVEANRPHYLVENWRSVLIRAASES